MRLQETWQVERTVQACGGESVGHGLSAQHTGKFAQDSYGWVAVISSVGSF